jgi:hypothetical protein
MNYRLRLIYGQRPESKNPKVFNHFYDEKGWNSPWAQG